MAENKLLDKKQQQGRADKLKQVQKKSFKSERAEVDAEAQMNIRYPVVSSEEEAAQYIKDLGLNDLKDIADDQAKAYHLYGFYDFLTQKKEAQDYPDQFAKLFQLAIFYDDNYIYRYFLARVLVEININDLALANLREALLQLQSKKTVLYPELNKDINLKQIQNDIVSLTKKLAQLQKGSQS